MLTNLNNYKRFYNYHFDEFSNNIQTIDLVAEKSSS